MTNPFSYEWFNLPSELTIICPFCQKQATFEFAKIFHIQGRKFQHFYENHPAFETERLYDPYAYIHKFCAIFYPTFHHDAPKIFQDIPDDHKSMTQHLAYLNKGFGAVKCIHCLSRRKHRLQWPQDAYYHIEYKGNILWAPSQSSFQSIHDYIASTDRDRFKYGHYYHLLHLPQHFLTKNARSEVCKKMQHFLQ